MVKNLKISTKLTAIQLASLFSLCLLLGVVYFSVTMLSAMRATVSAQGLWEKHQKLAHYNLISYVYTGDPKHYQRFREAEKIVTVYEDLRQEFLLGIPDYEYSFNLMVQGGSRPEDVPAILFLFKHFISVSYMQSAMKYWGNTHPLFISQDSLASIIHTDFNAGVPLQEMVSFIDPINQINNNLTHQGTTFSETIGEGSRWMEGLILKTLIIGSSLLGLFLIYMLYLTFSQIKFWISKLEVGTLEVSKGNLNHRISINESHELASLANEFNSMTNSLTNLINENKAIEAHLRELSLVASESDNAIFICNHEGYIEWVNKAFTTISGYSPDEIIGTRAEVLSPNNISTGLDPSSKRFEEMLAERKSVRYENENITKQGVRYWIITTLSPIFDDQGNLHKVIAMDVDVTKIKRSEIAMQKAKELAEASEKAKQLFLANMSHEIRTPMNAIIGFTELLQETNLDPEQKESLEAIKSSGENLLVLINDILDLAKIEANQIEFESIPFNIRDLAHGVCKMFTPKAASKNLNCELNIHEDIPEYLIGDPYRLNQIFINILSNAIKFTHVGSVTFSIDCEPINDSEVLLKFFIQDTGIGIPPHKQHLVFSNFTQASEGITRKFGGTGLGLSIVKQLVSHQNGTIELQSVENEGSIFSVAIPYKIASEDEAQSSKLRNTNHQNTLINRGVKGKLILIVEDNPVNQLLATRILTKLGYEIEVAENGKIAVEKTKNKLFDVILMDLQMPDLDGFQATTIIRTKGNLNNQTPIIAMTAHVLPGEKERCIKSGMNNYISKPFATKELNALIMSYLEQSNNWT